MKEFSYYLRQSALNSLKLLPTVGKKLNDSELNEIQTLIEKEEPSLSVKRQGSGLLITSSNFRLRDGDLSEMVSDCVPKQLTKKELKDAENQEKRKRLLKKKMSVSKIRLAQMKKLPSGLKTHSVLQT